MKMAHQSYMFSWRLLFLLFVVGGAPLIPIQQNGQQIGQGGQTQTLYRIPNSNQIVAFTSRCNCGGLPNKPASLKIPFFLIIWNITIHVLLVIGNRLSSIHWYTVIYDWQVLVVTPPPSSQWWPRGQVLKTWPPWPMSALQAYRPLKQVKTLEKMGKNLITYMCGYDG